MAILITAVLGGEMFSMAAVDGCLITEKGQASYVQSQQHTTFVQLFIQHVMLPVYMPLDVKIQGEVQNKQKQSRKTRIKI